MNRRSKETRRQCRCRNSRCLKLYCECFASGRYCDGCSCTDCHNVVENENIRGSAVESVLSRNPNAFRPKIVDSPCSSQDRDGKTNAGKNIKGCQCKRTGCLKKYCECFRANIRCCENCKCIECKNLEGCEQRMVHLRRSCGNSREFVEQTDAATFIAVGSSGYSFSQESRKRKFQKVIDSDMEDQEIQNVSQYQERNPVTVSSSFPVFCVDPACQIDRSTFLGSSNECRSLLADVIHPLDTKELCSLLVVVPEAAKIVTEMREAKENQKTVDPAEHDEKNPEKEPDIKKVVPESNLGGNEINTLNMNVPRDNGSNLEEKKPFLPQDFYAEQERLALTCLRDCLAKLLSFGKIKTAALSMAELESNQN